MRAIEHDTQEHLLSSLDLPEELTGDCDEDGGGNDDGHVQSVEENLLIATPPTDVDLEFN